MATAKPTIDYAGADVPAAGLRRDIDWRDVFWVASGVPALVLFSMYLIGFTQTLVVVLFGIVGYFIGKYLDGEIDPEDLRARAQGRRENEL